MVRTRIAPSPTGADLHIGSLYTALFNWAFAKQHKGQFIVRIEDTDQARLVHGAEEKFLTTLHNFGLDSDENPLKGGAYEPYRQSERLSLYQRYALELVQKGSAYYCFCSLERLAQLREHAKKEKRPSKYDRHCLNFKKEEVAEKLKQNTPHVIRLKIPEGATQFTDRIRGSIIIENHVLDDQVLIKSDGFPTYHLAVVVDDHLMDISHVIRGEEWISSTPKHIILYNAFGWGLPTFAHLPLLRNPDKSKLSKRKNPVWSSWYLEQGFLPQAVLNYLALMGWSHPEEKEIFTLEEFKSVLRLEKIQPVGPVFDDKKLEWINGEYIRASSPQELVDLLADYLKQNTDISIGKELLEATIPLVQTRIKKLTDYWPLVSFIVKQPEKIDFSLEYLKQAQNDIFAAYQSLEQWTSEVLYKTTEETAHKLSIKPIKLYMDIRYALSNQKVTAPLFESMELMGRNSVIKRLQKALDQ